MCKTNEDEYGINLIKYQVPFSDTDASRNYLLSSTVEVTVRTLQVVQDIKGVEKVSLAIDKAPYHKNYSMVVTIGKAFEIGNIIPEIVKILKG